MFPTNAIFLSDFVVCPGLTIIRPNVVTRGWPIIIPYDARWDDEVVGKHPIHALISRRVDVDINVHIQRRLEGMAKLSCPLKKTCI